MKKKKQDLCTCPKCKKIFDRQEVKRINGKESTVYLLKYCSAFCLTKRLTI